MSFTIAFLVMLISLIIAIYFSLIIVTVSKAEEMGIKMSFQTAVVLPGLILFVHLKKYIEFTYLGDRKRADAVMKIGILKYTVGLTILFTVIQHHVADVRQTGESPISNEISGVNRRGKAWTDSLATFKKVLSLDFYNDTLKYT